jgi:hypothetical protein
MSPMTSALISYWQRLPAESPAIRWSNLATLRDEVRAGRRPPDAATRAYLEGCATLPAAFHSAAVDAAVEWIRRGLALNRGSVFAALLGTADPGIHERLAAQRLVLSAEEVAVVCRQLPQAPAQPVLVFLREWAELVEGSDDPALARQRELLTGALDGSFLPAARLVAA